MAKVVLKKYLEEIIDTTLKDLIDSGTILHDFALNTQDKTLIKYEIKAHQKLTIKRDLIELKAKSTITVLGVAASKNFVERILNNLPIYERKEPLIVELAKSISRELQKLELKKKEYISSLSITTSNAVSLKRLEKIYGINPNYELGVKIRQNILIAREITRYCDFNYEYILKMCELFMLGKVKDIINDKIEQIISIILEDNINNISTLEEFKKHMNEFSPAFYEIKIINENREEK